MEPVVQFPLGLTAVPMNTPYVLGNLKKVSVNVWAKARSWRSAVWADCARGSRFVLPDPIPLTVWTVLLDQGFHCAGTTTLSPWRTHLRPTRQRLWSSHQREHLQLLHGWATLSAASHCVSNTLMTLIKTSPFHSKRTNSHCRTCFTLSSRVGFTVPCCARFTLPGRACVIVWQVKTDPGTETVSCRVSLLKSGTSSGW